MRPLLTTILLLAATVAGQAATITGAVKVATSAAFKVAPTFTPLNAPWQEAGETISSLPVTATLTTSNTFSTYLYGNLYKVDFGSYSKPFNILVPPSDTATYSLAYVASLATNLPVFALSTNLPILRRPSQMILKGSNLTFTTNNAGLNTETLTIAGSASAGAATNAPWPAAGTGITAETNGLTVTLSADVTTDTLSNYVQHSAGGTGIGITNALDAEMGIVANDNISTNFTFHIPPDSSEILGLSTTYATKVELTAATNGLGGGDVTLAQLQSATNDIPGTYATKTELASSTNNMAKVADVNASTNGLLSAATAASTYSTKTETQSSTNSLWSAVLAQILGSTNSLWSATDARVTGATNGLFTILSQAIVNSTNNMVLAAAYAASSGSVTGSVPVAQISGALPANQVNGAVSNATYALTAGTATYATGNGTTLTNHVYGTNIDGAITADTFNVGSLVVTNAPYLNLLNSTNLVADTYRSLTNAVTDPGTSVDFSKGTLFVTTNAAFTITGFKGYATSNDCQCLWVVTNSAATTFDITINAVNLQNSVKCGITNGQYTYLFFHYRPGFTNAFARDTYGDRLK